jgi:hypothetical protein
VLDVLERVNSAQPLEDFGVELKAEWIGPRKAARRIAGHANAARGEPILWIIGVDEDQGIIGAESNDLASWYSAVASEFDGLAPDLTDLNVPVSGKTVVALLFETDRAPFVVKNPSFGIEKGEAVSHEVPWREGTHTRTARRSDLVRVLTPLFYLPEFELRNGQLSAHFSERDNTVGWKLELELYVTVRRHSQGVVIPFHRCDVSFEIQGRFPRTEMSRISLKPPYRTVYRPAPVAASMATRFGSQVVQPAGSEPDSLTIGHTQNEVFIEGPGALLLNAETKTELSDLAFRDSCAIIEVRVMPVQAERSVPISARLAWSEPDKHGLGKWVHMRA